MGSSKSKNIRYQPSYFGCVKCKNVINISYKYNISCVCNEGEHNWCRSCVEKHLLLQSSPEWIFIEIDFCPRSITSIPV